MKLRLWAILATMALLAAWFTTASAETVDGGACGEEVIWKLTNDGVMTISGTGAMENFDSSVPWEHLKDMITTIDIKDGVTGIGDNAFTNCQQLISVICPNSLRFIGSHAFSSCTSLQSIVFPSHLNHIGEGAFLWCTSLYISYFQE